MVNKVAVIGTGSVGTSYAYAMVNQGITDKMVLIDINEEKAKGEAIDLNDAVENAPFHTTISSGTYEDCKDADIVCITAGIPQQFKGETRLQALDRNVNIFKSIVDPVMASGFDGIFLVVSNPVDIMTYVTWKASGLPKERVIGTGTLLDTARFRFRVGKHFDVNPKDVQGYIIGEHGDSLVPAWSATTIGGLHVEKMIQASNEYDMKDLTIIHEEIKSWAYQITERKGHTDFGIGMAAAKLTKAILRDENTILPISTYLDGEYGAQDIYAGVPARVTREGVKEIIEIDLNEEEQTLFNKSIDVLKESLNSVTL